jgi:ubiquinone/menaquinone biosynthesis C-methylase UbiE
LEAPDFVPYRDECLLYNEPELYDLLFPDAREAEYIDDETRAQRLLASEHFYMEEARRTGGQALELACGSGRLTIPLAQAGVDIVGLDSSQPMLNAARVKASAASVMVNLVQADMRTFELSERFSTIYMAGNSLLHLLTKEDLKQCLQTVRRHLMSEGRFVFDVMNPNLHLLTRDGLQRYPVLRVRTPDRGQITVEEVTNYDHSSQINHVIWYLSAPDAQDFRVVEYLLRVIFPQELELLLEYCGLRMTARYGEFTREQFTSSSPRQICVCSRA